MKGIVGKVVEVEEFERGGVEEALVEGFAEVVVVEKEGEFLQDSGKVLRRSVGIEPLKSRFEEFGEDVSVEVPLGLRERQVAIS